MNPEYQVRLHWMGAEPASLKLSEAHAEKLRKSADVIWSALELEELFDAVIDDYLELENSILSAASFHAVRHGKSSFDIHSTRRTLNRRMMHLLTTARTYLDSTPKLVARIDGGIRDPRAAYSHEYDARLGYRVLEAMRNLAQHHGFPIHGVSLGGRWLERTATTTETIMYYCAPYVLLRELEKDPKFKPKVLAELKVAGDKIDVRPLAREYVDGLASAHAQIRASIEAATQSASDYLQYTIDAWQKISNGSDPLGLHLVRMETASTWQPLCSISVGGIERRRALLDANRLPLNMTKSHVSGAIYSDDA